MRAKRRLHRTLISAALVILLQLAGGPLASLSTGSVGLTRAVQAEAPQQGATTGSGPTTAGGLTAADYQKIYDEAARLLEIGVKFRQDELEKAKADLAKEIKKNYADIDAQVFERFCSDYSPDRIDAAGRCAGKDDIRNQLLEAQRLFGWLAVAEPADIRIKSPGCSELCSAVSLGTTGVVSATRELAGIHMIFGNEFLVDALGQAYTADAAAALNATALSAKIIREELDQLKRAQRQFEMASELLTYALNGALGGSATIQHISDYLGPQELRLFGAASERMVMTLREMADRYRLLGEEDKAWDLYRTAFNTQYLQALALADAAETRGAAFGDAGGSGMASNLGELRAQAAAIEQKLNPFGYPEKYVPLSSYEDLLFQARRTLVELQKAEDAADKAKRDYLTNRDALAQQLADLRGGYDRQLRQLCGTNVNDCDSGAMAANLARARAAYERVRLADQRLDNIPKLIEIAAGTAAQTAQVILKSGEEKALLDYASTILSAHTVQQSHSTSSTRTDTVGVSLQVGWGLKLPEASASASVSRSWATSTSDSITESWNPFGDKIAELAKLRELRGAAEQAQIVNIDNEAAIRNLLVTQAELLIERRIALDDYEAVLVEHNNLVEERLELIRLQALAQNDLVDSYLNDPAYSILRDSSVLQAARKRGEAAIYAFLAGKALEYKYLLPQTGPSRIDFDRIYQARRASTLEDFLGYLETIATSMSPVHANPFAYKISLGKDLFGLQGTTDPVLFQKALEFYVTRDATGKIKSAAIPFSTSLLLSKSNGAGYIFGDAVWNQQITGGSNCPPLGPTGGVRVKIFTSEAVFLQSPTVRLKHGGHASYRNLLADIVEYDPSPARMPGYVVQPELLNPDKWATIQAAVEGDATLTGSPNGDFCRRSVAASSWMLQLDGSKLDISKIQDIVIEMDTGAYSLQGNN